MPNHKARHDMTGQPEEIRQPEDMSTQNKRTHENQKKITGRDNQNVAILQEKASRVGQDLNKGREDNKNPKISQTSCPAAGTSASPI